MSDHLQAARNPAGLGTWIIECIDETRRVTPRGAIGVFVSALSVIATLIISYYALFAHASQHFQMLDRFRHVIICAGFVTFDDIFFLIACSEIDDWN